MDGMTNPMSAISPLPGPGRTAVLLSAVGAVLAGTAYCQVHALFAGGSRVGIAESLLWSIATLAPWAAALAAFERREPSIAAAVGLAAAAALLSSLVAAALGASGAEALYLRLPFIAVAAGYAGLRISLVKRAPTARAGGETLPCHPADIRLAVAAENYVELRLPHRTLLWRRTMRDAEAALAPHGFVRVHRSYIVPRSRIASANSTALETTDGERLPISRPYRSRLG